MVDAPRGDAIADRVEDRDAASERPVQRVGRAAAHREDHGVDALDAPRLAAFKFPRRVSIVPELPKSPTGKILKSRLTL